MRRSAVNNICIFAVVDFLITACFVGLKNFNRSEKEFVEFDVDSGVSLNAALRLSQSAGPNPRKEVIGSTIPGIGGNSTCCSISWNIRKTNTQSASSLV